MRVRLTEISHNKKTGPMPVSTTEEKSCPLSCPLKGQGCYAEYGPGLWHWRKVKDSGVPWGDFVSRVRRLPKLQLWRHNQAGDLPSEDGVSIDEEKLTSLVNANKRKRGFTYTHYTDEASLPIVKKANDSGFTINLSANNYDEVDRLIGKGSPVVTIMEEGASKVEFTAGNNKVVPCPHSTGKAVNCMHCGLCQIADRDYVIGFPAHGIGKRKALEATRSPQ
ncbi:hypothetical protein DRQ50_11710 [bacterium]|nr:MAG: hypothetical protein DRQ50_11710 [bacterium]